MGKEAFDIFVVGIIIGIVTGIIQAISQIDPIYFSSALGIINGAIMISILINAREFWIWDDLHHSEINARVVIDFIVLHLGVAIIFMLILWIWDFTVISATSFLVSASISLGISILTIVIFLLIYLFQKAWRNWKTRRTQKTTT